jgi:hypothetical protein
MWGSERHRSAAVFLCLARGGEKKEKEKSKSGGRGATSAMPALCCSSRQRSAEDEQCAFLLATPMACLQRTPRLMGKPGFTIRYIMACIFTSVIRMRNMCEHVGSVGPLTTCATLCMTSGEPSRGLLKKKKQIADHALTQRGFGLGTPGAEGGKAMPEGVEARSAVLQCAANPSDVCSPDAARCSMCELMDGH